MNQFKERSETRRTGTPVEAGSSVDSAAARDARWQGPSAGFAINGKFASQRITGVQRVGYELATAFQRLFPEDADLPLLVPGDARADVPLPKAKSVFGWLKGSLWEQLALPFAAGGRTLLSLCNMGPLFARRQVVMMHDVAVYDLPENYSWKFRLWYRVAFSVLKRSASHIVTVSEFSKKRIMARLGIDASRISVVLNGVDHFDKIAPDAGILSRLNLQNDGYVLAVGNLSVGKNLARVLAAIESLSERHDWKFVVVGGCDLRVFNPKAKAGYEMSKNIVAAGFVSDGELRALYENAACFLFPSLYEGFGLPPLEAMACGCPVIVSREASLPEVCGDAAMYCDALSVEDIAEKVTQMMGDAALRETWRTRGRAHARSFRWDRSAQQLLDVLERELAGGVARPVASRAATSRV
ncbi:glycosyltransferase family 1 protein [Paraburkholderia sp. DHOC27]|uniref:glycosyltransferase family 4 protein n=1 Tax=Paraburkholderia sp. DHOC27 TaxID=2303330 RepID=UPI000E3D0626|nr:glycosyltransferase family 1 protein [Paraburkholderia sp. DHOC27]RFU46022.1 glycosyltransferase family 1 protein [Paraburkholderia sp. DHOC27]